MSTRRKPPAAVGEPRHAEGSSVAEMCAEPCPNLGGAWERVAWLQAVGWRVEEQATVTVARVYHPVSGEHVADVTCLPAGSADGGMAVL